MDTVDLHMHSSFSDGTDTPERLAEICSRAGLRAFALTDHDTVNGIPEVIAAGIKYNIETVPGIELAADYNGREIHIVGLFIDHNSTALSEYIRTEEERRCSRNIRMTELCNEAGFPVTYDELCSMFPGSIITRAHFASCMVHHGYAGSVKEAFDRYLGDGRPLYVPRTRRAPEDAVNVIREAHGAAILAHPLLYHMSYGELKKLCIQLKNSGLTGIESMYSAYRGFEEITVRRLAGECGLLESGGSDYHGTVKPHIRPGTGTGRLMISYDYLRKIKESLITKQCN